MAALAAAAAQAAPYHEPHIHRPPRIVRAGRVCQAAAALAGLRHGAEQRRTSGEEVSLENELEYVCGQIDRMGKPQERYLLASAMATVHE